MRLTPAKRCLVCLFLCVFLHAAAQSHVQGSATAQLQLNINGQRTQKHHHTPAVVWFEPLADTPQVPFTTRGSYTLLQKNRTFLPHLQVVPVGSAVQFPNADPFFHNVFSLFDGKRFDLGLYEAGSSRSVMFSREGVSYIFCNLHPEMSAVVVSITTPFFSIADQNDTFTVRDMPPGDYKMNIWVEGLPQTSLDYLGRLVHFVAGTNDVGTLNITVPASGTTHQNKFGKPYDPDLKTTY